MIWNIRKEKQPIRETGRKNNPKKKTKNENSISSLRDNFKCSSIRNIGVPEGKKKKQEIGNLFEKVMKGNFPNLVKETDMQVPKAQRVPNKMDTRRPNPRHITITMSKVKEKERILKAAREKKLVIYGGVPISLSADF